MGKALKKADHRAERRKQTAEVFTPESLVNQMLDKLPAELCKECKTFCDPACGNGNILVVVLRRKIAAGHDPLAAIKTIYGVDIMADNILECQVRILKECSKSQKITDQHIQDVCENIVCLDQEVYPNGALDYDFSFDFEIPQEYFAQVKQEFLKC